VRVDLPSDVRVTAPSECPLDDLILTAESAQANAAYAENLFKQALMHSTWEDVVALLANRAQAALSEQQWADALADSAAVLILRPGHEKAWARYAKALWGLGLHSLASRARAAAYADKSQAKPEVPQGNVEDVRSALWYGISVWLQTVLPRSGGLVTPTQLKEAGNVQYQSAHFREAWELYTIGLDISDHLGPLFRCLSGLCQTSLKLGRPHNVIAFANVAMRLNAQNHHMSFTGYLVNALGCLQEVGMVEALVAHFPALFEKTPDALSLALKFSGESPFQVRCLADVSSNKPHAVLVRPHYDEEPQDWYHTFFPEKILSVVEVCTSHGKGRGVFAAKDIPEHWPILLAKPLQTASSDDLLFQAWTGKQYVTEEQYQLESSLAHSSSADEELSWKLSQLSDGSEHVPDVLQLHELLLTLSPRWLPFLGQKGRYYPPQNHRPLSKLKLDRIVRVNAHGVAELRHRTSQLYPAVSLFNHAKAANACMVPVVNSKTSEQFEDGIAIVTCCPIMKGQEITLTYSTDAEALKNTWGIEE